MSAAARARALLAVVALAAPAHAAPARAPLPPPPPPCERAAVRFHEIVEPVIEALTDGRPARQRAAADRAADWWTLHQKDYAANPAVERAFRRMLAAADDRAAGLAAQAAVEASNAALTLCDGGTDAQRLAALDGVGASAWLRAHGIRSLGPANGAAAAAALQQRLAATGQPALGARLRATADSALAIRQSLHGPHATASRLLDLVDEVEVTLRRASVRPAAPAPRPAGH